MIDFLGGYLGEGFRRIVYAHKDREDLVIKFLKNLEDNHNRTEFDNWQKFKDTDQGRWLAPCYSLSNDGRFLVQQRVEVLDEAPQSVPEWIKTLRDWSFGGNQSKHWGSWDGRVLLIDYGDMPL
jgi:hypothetical protein